MENQEAFLEGLNTLLEAEEYQQVLAQTEEALKQEPDESVYYLYRGYAFQGLHRKDEALNAFGMAIAKEPNDEMARLGYGTIYEEKGQYVDALNAYDAALLINPESVEAATYAGNILVNLGLLGDAANAYHRALDNDPNNWSLGNTVADLYTTLGNMEQALELYPKLLKQKATFPLQLKYGSALLYFLQNGADHAVIAGAADNWKKMFPSDAFVAQFAEALITNQVHYHPLSVGVIQKLFDDADSSFRETDFPFPMKEVLSKTYTQAKGNLVILDMGCGAGTYAQDLKPYAALLTGVDVSAKMLDKAHAKGLYHKLFNCDFGALLAARPATFDLIFAVRSFNYTLLTKEMIAKMVSALKENGKIILTVEQNSLDDNLSAFVPPFNYEYNTSALSKMFKEAGLTVIDEYPCSTGVEDVIIYTLLKV